MAQQDPVETAPQAPVAPQVPVAPQYVAQGVPAAPVERPSSITRAVQLMYVGAALSLVGIVVAWATKSQIHDKVASSTTSTTLSASDIDTIVNVSLVLATVAGLVGAGLWLWMAAVNRAGRSWARIVATVLGGLNLLLTLANLARSSGVSIVLALVSIVLAVAILVLLWRGESSAYYRASDAARRA